MSQQFYLVLDKNVTDKKTDRNKHKDINFEQLLQHFIAVQDKHKEYKKVSRAKDLYAVGDIPQPNRNT